MATAREGNGHSIGEIATGLAGDVQDLVRGELALARAEFDQKLHRLLIATIAIVGGGLVGFAGLIVLLEGGATILSFWLPAWASLLIVGTLIMLIGALVSRIALAKLSIKAIAPDRSMASLEKDSHILKEHL